MAAADGDDGGVESALRSRLSQRRQRIALAATGDGGLSEDTTDWGTSTLPARQARSVVSRASAAAGGGNDSGSESVEEIPSLDAAAAPDANDRGGDGDDAATLEPSRRRALKRRSSLSALRRSFSSGSKSKKDSNSAAASGDEDDGDGDGDGHGDGLGEEGDGKKVAKDKKSKKKKKSKKEKDKNGVPDGEGGEAADGASIGSTKGDNQSQGNGSNQDSVSRQGSEDGRSEGPGDRPPRRTGSRGVRRSVDLIALKQQEAERKAQLLKRVRERSVSRKQKLEEERKKAEQSEQEPQPDEENADKQANGSTPADEAEGSDDVPPPQQLKGRRQLLSRKGTRFDGEQPTVVPAATVEPAATARSTGAFRTPIPLADLSIKPVDQLRPASKLAPIARVEAPEPKADAVIPTRLLPTREVDAFEFFASPDPTHIARPELQPRPRPQAHQQQQQAQQPSLPPPAQRHAGPLEGADDGIRPAASEAEPGQPQQTTANVDDMVHRLLETQHEEPNYFDRVVQGANEWLQGQLLEPADVLKHDPRELHAQLDDLYFMSSSRPVPMDFRLPEGESQPWNLEDEGFFVGHPPAMTSRQLLTFENRLLELHDRGRAWYGVDGQVKRLPDPVTKAPKRARPADVTALDDLVMPCKPKADRHQFQELHTVTVDREHQYDLELMISSIVFTGHPLFSEEHVLSSELVQLCEQARVRREANMFGYLTEKMAALKAEVGELRKELAGASNQQEDAMFDVLEIAAVRQQQRERLTLYEIELKQTRQRREEEERHDLNLARSILKTWDNMKQLRATQGYSCTPWSLSVYQEPHDAEQDRIRYEAEIEDELEDMRHAFKREQKRQQREYMERNARRYQDLAAAGDPAADEIDLDYLPSNLMQEFNAVAAREAIVTRIQQTRRPMGQPDLRCVLSPSMDISPTDRCTPQERRRRQLTQACSTFVKVVLNGKDVSRTQARPLNNDFESSFDTTFDIKVDAWPESIVLELWEVSQGAVGKHTQLAEVFVPVPEANVLLPQAPAVEYQFSCEGREFFGFAEDLDAHTQVMSGVLSVRVGWGAGASGEALSPPLPTTMPAPQPTTHASLAAMGAGAVEPAKLRDWVAHAGIDPNDPRNFHLLDLMASEDTSPTPQSQPCFRLDDQANLLSLSEHDEKQQAELSARDRLLVLRAQKTPGYTSFGPVPLLQHEIPLEVFDAADRLGKEEKPRHDVTRFLHSAQAAYLRKIRQEQLALLRASQQRVVLSDVVQEDPIPDFGTIGTLIKQAFAPKRPLRPRRKPRKKVGMVGALMHFDILVRVNRASNVPMRAQPATRAPNPAETSAADATQTPALDFHDRLRAEVVQPFVEVVFQDHMRATSVATGSQPSWNEELRIPFSTKAATFDAVQSCVDDIHINLFDEMLRDILEDDREKETQIHKRRERHWLGSLSIPFSTVYFQQQMEGSFKLDVPIQLLGYYRSSEGGALDQHDTMLSLYITLDPPLMPHMPAVIKPTSVEDPTFVNYASNWAASLQSKFPNRNFTTLVQDLNGMAVFVTRYVHKQDPPPSIVERADVIQDRLKWLARFVSLIPFAADFTSFPGSTDLWMTSDQFLQLRAGDAEEHAVLLCNFFLACDVRAHLVIGTGLPEGDTVYVLSRVDGQTRLWNAVTGQSYDPHDFFCPLNQVCTVVSNNNIWANIQPHAEPSRMDFTLHNSQAWKPLFSESFLNPGLASNQVERLTFVPTSLTCVQDLKHELEAILMEQTEAWRSRFPTRWNRYAMGVLEEELKFMESATVLGTKPPLSHGLLQLLVTHEIVGYPLNMPFTTIDRVVTAVRNTHIHESEHPNVELAIAVHFDVYPSNVLSLWVYVAALVPKDT